MDLTTRILVVDDDAGIREVVASFLRGHGYIVDDAQDGPAMRTRLQTAHYDLIVLDVMMPGEDGLTLLRGLDRQRAPAVIMLSVIGQDVDRIVGLEMGADDYLAKPVNPRELLARIRSVLRRRDQASPNAPTIRAVVTFAGWSLDTTARQLTDPEGILVNLSDGEYRLLDTMLGHPRRVLTRDFILEHSRGVNAEHFDRAIDVQVSRLRRKLDRSDDRAGEDLIRTVRNEGYMFTADVRKA
ncbi:response regulator [Sphingomonas sp. STIS6.2]|uniref:response regulator n=1 Tax=Sphingomonas sp. STIS6.2 TaxID=1379700 RepID=UPI0005B96AA8|nr:response regulator [Sphingomonas sp. STIS6.2]